MTLAALATYSDVMALLDRTIDQDDRVNRLLEMASAVARNFMGQQITHVTGDTVLVMPDEWELLWLPQRPVITITSISMGATVYSPTAYNLRSDGAVRSAWGRPWRFLAINASGAPVELSVVYEHGFLVVPDDIVTVVAQMAADVIQRTWRSTPEGGGATPVAGLGLNLNKAQKTVLNRYRMNYTSNDVLPPRAPAFTW